MGGIATIVDVVTEEWCDVLGVRSADVDDDFFSIGGESKLALDFVGRVERRLNIAFPLEVLFVDGTFGAVVGACEEQAGTRSNG